MPDASSQNEERLSLDRMIGDLNALEMLADGWDEAARNGAQARAEAVDALNKEAFRRLISALKDLPEFGSALRDAAQDEIVYAVLRRHGILKPSLYERVEAALESVRPSLASHGGDAEIALVEGNRAEIRFLGACDGCPASQLTFYAGVKKAIQEQVPEITEVKQAKGFGGGGSDGVQFTSPFANYGDSEWSTAMALDEIADGETHIVDVDGNSVILTRFESKVSCFKNACAHMGLEMTQGEIKEAIITCPHHGFKYALESGECITAPEVQLQPHAVRVKGPNIEVRIVS